MCIYIYIYIYVERERERLHVHVACYLDTHHGAFQGHRTAAYWARTRSRSPRICLFARAASPPLPPKIPAPTRAGPHRPGLSEFTEDIPDECLVFIRRRVGS